MLLDMKKDICQQSVSLMKTNRFILRQITKFVAELNAEYYNEILQEQLTREQFDFIHQSTTPLEDAWGRVTHFYTMIGPHTILLYQPGTPTFMSSVYGNCDLATCHDNCQQNGAILGMGCACFLAKFMTYLSQQYQHMCAQEMVSSNNFHPSLYGKALDICLETFAAEDAAAHGRLLEIKDLLLHVGGQQEIKCELLHLFYLKDIAVQQQNNADYDRIVHSRLRLSQVDFDRLVNRREQYRTYKRFDNYFETATTNDLDKPDSNNGGRDFINSELWHTMRDGILNKNNIFKDQDLARVWLKITFEEFEKNLQQCSPNESLLSTVTRQDLERDYKLEKNEKLMEYYVQLQLGMESLFRSAVIADADIFELKTPSICTILDLIGDLIPEVNLIMKSISIAIGESTKWMIEKKLKDLCQLSIRFSQLPEKLARKATIMKRNHINKLGESDQIGLSVRFENMLRPIVKMKKLSIQQILAIRDTKLLEACCIKLLCNDDINPLTEHDELEIIKKILLELKNIHYSWQLSPDLQTSEEQPAEFQRMNKFVIPDCFFDLQINHRFMKCMEDEPERKHRERVKNYLMRLSESKIAELIGCIDPSESTLNPLLILLLEVQKEKHRFCSIS
ncbi:unnamed protein product [Rotaria magnacalcarata]|nr:unnamed protein product [Rotaria magnacalcarata]